jgi:cbb3-type cytochrome oxidase subunit 1
VRLVGGTLMFLGILIFFWNLLVTWTGRRDRPAVAA